MLVQENFVQNIFFLSIHNFTSFVLIAHRAPTPPSSSTQGKAGRNHLNEEIIPLLPFGKDERFSQTIPNLGHAALLHRCERPLYPPRNESAEL